MSLSRRMPRTILAAATSAIMLTGLVAPSATAFTGSSMGHESSTGLPGVKTAPKNIIYMVGDGMGYNHVAAANLYESGQTRYQVEGEAGSDLSEAPGEAVQVYEGDKWNQLAMTTFQHDNSYEPDRAWADHNYVKENFTDSAAAGTAMATGEKTENGKIGVDETDASVENTSERAKAEGKAAGVVSSVPFNHATPAAWAAHNPNRNDLNNMAEEMINSDLDVIMGAGHPFFNNDNQHVTTADEDYMTAEQYERLSNGETEFNFIEEDSDFEALANGELDGERYFGLAQVADTLQHDRSGNSVTPYDTALNDVVDLATMSEGALNVLNQDEDGFHLMIEGGAIDWAGHANDIARDIEEVQAFNEAVETVVTWVEENSSWDETLVIVTADHETGYLSGQSETPDYKALTGAVGEVPAHDYYSGNHTNMLVPVFFRGAGSEDIARSATGTDAVRGKYIDNITIANLTLDKWWARN
ncbi:alkaline phosphatase [Corynebacterium hylobatis]|uniref:Alkaline phosphatase n=1 Tax=Corynebacterium hylobatis TaxID=1859290 RepID=A0A3S0AW13_9CORY|nr:alkaline phosphatase [Corynebacterium hylobatis]RSZ63156.1 alkaline phosphatase [Corynebacterium hylobatis]